MARFGFNFVRLPLDYRYWTTDFDYFHPHEAIFEQIDLYLAACRGRGFHVSLNLHRAPGYCINRNDLERHNLWLDSVAQDAFVFLWETFARRYQRVPPAYLSFDLLNEPPSVGQYGLTRESHAALIRRTLAAIRAIDPARPLVIDGLDGGHTALPELADLGVVHSGRGYQPYPVSHWGVDWSDGWRGAPAPIYPGLQWLGKTWDQATLRKLYQPWRAVEAAGVTVHIGEVGCYRQTPNAVALRWLADLLGLFREFGWGYALWELEGPFGVAEHGRPGAVYEAIGGFSVDRALLDLMLNSRVSPR
ncbi:MAG: cellulase family glycosylhydrolase [Anaerolineae bacterium]|nr:cellulase family glycosylhydrolase [Anaerolineae bacterium]